MVGGSVSFVLPEGPGGYRRTWPDSSGILFQRAPLLNTKVSGKESLGELFDCGVREEKIGLDSVSLLTDLSELEGVMKSSAK